jgi:hypothetical protein
MLAHRVRACRQPPGLWDRSWFGRECDDQSRAAFDCGLLYYRSFCHGGSTDRHPHYRHKSGCYLRTGGGPVAVSVSRGEAY